MFTTIIFDLDGTLLNTLEDLCDSTNFALKKFNLPKRNFDEIKNFVGDGVEKLIERAAPKLNSHEASQCVKIFKNHYRDNMYNKTKPYPDILETLKKLKENNKNIAVVSNKFDEAVKEVCTYYFGSLIDTAAGHKDSIPPKPSPEAVFNVLCSLNVKNFDEVLFVGDSQTDILTAKNAGLKCTGVTWGYRPKSVLINEGADYTADSPLELLKIIL